MAGTTSGWGLASSMIGTYLSNHAENKRIEDQNELDQQAFDFALSKLRDQLTVAYQRTQTGLSEINRDKLTRQLAVRKAGIEGRGEATVQAAQLGVQGRRGSSTAKDITREEANLISEANIDAAVEESNAINAFNDAANQAVSNLNMHRPFAVQTKSTGEMLTESIGSGLTYYTKLSSAQKADLKSTFNWKIKTKLSNPKVEAPYIGW